MSKKLFGIFLTIMLMVSVATSCSAQARIHCFFVTSNDQFRWTGCFDTKYFKALERESSKATNGNIVFVANKQEYYNMATDWLTNGLSLNEIARKYNYDFVMKIFVQKPNEDLVHFNAPDHKFDYYDVLSIPMVCVIADNENWERVVSPGSGGTLTHGLLSRENGHYVNFINQIRGLVYSVSGVISMRDCVDPELRDLTEQEERHIEQYGEY